MAAKGVAAKGVAAKGVAAKNITDITDPTPAPPRKGRVQEGSGYRSRYAQQFPSLQGEGQGWGL